MTRKVSPYLFKVLWGSTEVKHKSELNVAHIVADTFLEAAKMAYKRFEGEEFSADNIADDGGYLIVYGVELIDVIEIDLSMWDKEG